ncbi:uncharacterized protein LOC123547951 [Mercenaria mercenaria]|uniref:uncharacterized protein LOC123547951 n=1 Tax=Mercenaria mercenaria TaxID=6596 RepID=UPI00234EEB76|nr:uncharacterized protein LOC123547951 [Mercenaria mercenaria]
MKGAAQIMFTRKVMAMLLLSTLLHLIGFVSPGWFFMTVKHVKLHVGIWYGVICDANACSSDTIGNLNQTYFKFKDLEPLSSVLSKYQVLAAIALAASLISILANIVHRRTNKKLRSMWAVGICIICIFLSGILGIVTSAHFANRLRYATNYLATLGEENPYSVPYSIVFTGLGGLVALIAYSIVAYNVAMDRDRKEITNVNEVYSLRQI